MIQLESRVMIQGKLTGNMGKERILQEKTPIFWSTAIFHLYCLSPITEQNTCPVFANPPLQVFTQSKASTASKQLSNFKPTSFLLPKHWICVPKGPLGTACYDLLLIDNTEQSVYRQQGICLGANPPVPAIKGRQEHPHWGHSIKGCCSEATQPCRMLTQMCRANSRDGELAKSWAVPFTHIAPNALHNTSCLP